MRWRFPWGFVVFLLAAVWTSSAAQAGPFTNIFVFGDSTVDPGNAQVAAPLFSLPDPTPAALGYYDGRFSNGPTYADLLNQAYGTGSEFDPALTVAGMPPGPVFTGGSNFAFGGANVIPPMGDPVEAATSLGAQIGYFEAVFGAGPNSVPADSLVLFNIGGNDLRDILTGLVDDTLPVSAIPGLVSPVVGGIGTAINAMIGHGADKVLVANVPNVGLFPERGGSVEAAVEGDALSLAFNTALESVLGTFSATDMRLLDLDGLFDDILASDVFANETTPCLAGMMMCSNPGDYLFWDPVHITAAAHRLIFAEASRGIPAPPTVWLMLAGLGALIFVFRFRVSSRKQASA